MNTDSDESPFELPTKFEKIMASLSIKYDTSHQDQLKRIVVNTRYEIDEGVSSYQDWGVEHWSHAIHLFLQPALYAEISTKLHDLTERLANDMNSLANLRTEHISTVYVELDDRGIPDWREKSGVLMEPSPATIAVAPEAIKRIWTPGFIRVFLSHKAEYKTQAAQLKDALSPYGLSGFVAHEDIEPAREWLDEIEWALQSMHVMVLLLTERFHESKWTDQEVGIAIGRGVPVIPIRIDIDPYGFAGKFQALPGRDRRAADLAGDLVGLLSRNPNFDGRMAEALVARLEQSQSYMQTKAVVQQLNHLESLSAELVDRLEKAPKMNDQVGGSVVASQVLPGLIRRLRRRLQNA